MDTYTLDPHLSANDVYGLFIHTDKPYKPYNSSQRHTHNYCEFSLFTNGDIVHIVNDSTQYIKDRTLCFVRSSDIHYYKKTNNNLTEFYNIGIPNDILLNALNYLKISKDFLFKPEESFAISLTPEQYNSLYQKCKNFMETDFGPKHGFIFSILVSEVICTLLVSDQSQQRQTLNLPGWFSDLLNLIEQNNNAFLTPKDLENMCNYSYNHIIRCFNKYLHCTPTEYLNRLKTERAADMLLNSNKTILEVGMMSGFNNETYFYKQFKKYYHMTPKEYVKLNKTNK